jgi:hypothetical protein
MHAPADVARQLQGQDVVSEEALDRERVDPLVPLEPYSGTAAGGQGTGKGRPGDACRPTLTACLCV